MKPGDLVRAKRKNSVLSRRTYFRIQPGRSYIVTDVAVSSHGRLFIRVWGKPWRFAADGFEVISESR
jgi:hypothetical protein